ncbi:Uncharacterised protein [Streptococcus pneumoniae]|nr:Uncharacterised protein [Streptococcus pneumoniae]
MILEVHKAHDVINFRVVGNASIVGSGVFRIFPRHVRIGFCQLTLILLDKAGA